MFCMNFAVDSNILVTCIDFPDSHSTHIWESAEKCGSPHFFNKRNSVQIMLYFIESSRSSTM